MRKLASPRSKSASTKRLRSISLSMALSSDVFGRATAKDSEEWTIGHPQIWPGTAVLTYPNGWVQAQIRVPLNDTETAIYWYNAKLRPEGAAPKTDCPVWENRFRKSDGSYSPETLNGQDMMVMVTQGEIADRSLETLAELDRGIAMYRRVLLEQVEKVARGEDPLGVVRDEAQNTPFIDLPMEKQVHILFGGRDGVSGHCLGSGSAEPSGGMKQSKARDTISALRHIALDVHRKGKASIGYVSDHAFSRMVT